MELIFRYDHTLRDTLEKTEVLLLDENSLQQESPQMYTMRSILHSDLDNDLVMSICGILLPKQSNVKQVLLVICN
jgi:hypothetical protein